MLYYIILHHNISYHIISCYIILYYIILYYVILHYNPLYHITPEFVVRTPPLEMEIRPIQGGGGSYSFGAPFGIWADSGGGFLAGRAGHAHNDIPRVLRMQ